MENKRMASLKSLMEEELSDVEGKKHLYIYGNSGEFGWFFSRVASGTDRVHYSFFLMWLWVG
uniref:Putative ovule protein n=1 Tax=Solanum chacoense TaxID=4108 RepID=A0A0V0HRJ3_SOLCH